MLNEENWSEITDINKWADGMLTVLLEQGISYMLVKEA